MTNPMDLTGKHILIIGASSGIGRETAVQASQLGATVSIVARREEQLNETLALMESGAHAAYPFDVTNLAGIEALLAEIVAKNGKLDGLAYCAGISPVRPLSLTTPEFIQNTFQINFFPFVEFTRFLGKKKYTNNGGSIVGVSSIAATRGDKSQGAYSASKAAIEGIVPPTARELAPRKIRVNAVAFGMIDTGMFQAYLDSGSSEEALRMHQYLDIGKPYDGACTINFLLSDASALTTGAVFHVDGGAFS